MDQKDLKNYLQKLSKGKGYHPLKYYKGLTKSEVLHRFKHGPTEKTDKGKKTKASKYTIAFKKIYPTATSLKSKSIVTGVPLLIIKDVFNRGLAAWRTGHRPGASQSAWGYARVHSFLMKGCTYYKTDSDLVRKAHKKMNPLDKKKWNNLKSMC